MNEQKNQQQTNQTDKTAQKTAEQAETVEKQDTSQAADGRDEAGGQKTNHLTQSRIIEAVLFATDTPVDAGLLCEISGGITDLELLDIIDRLNEEFNDTGRSFRIVEVAGGFQFETLPQYGPFVEQLFRTRSRPKLSRAALETLAIVAYKQPVTRSEVDALRGVDSDGSIRTLLNRELVKVVGQAETVGKPRLYGTTKEFLRYFGLNDIGDLPGADELASMFDGTEVEEVSPDQLSLEESFISNNENDDNEKEEDNSG